MRPRRPSAAVRWPCAAVQARPELLSGVSVPWTATAPAIDQINAALSE